MQQTDAATEPPRMRELAHDVAAYLAALHELADVEIALARRSFRAILLGVLFAPVLLLGAWLSLIALSTIAMHSLQLSWLAASTIAFLLQALTAASLFWATRRWWRNLSLPRTRIAISNLVDSP